MQAILGQRLSSDINLAAQLLILVGLWVGFVFARRKNFRNHRRMQTTMVLTNSFFIVFVMFTSFYNYVIAGGTTTGTVASLMMVHGVLGLVAELTGIYLIVRMNTRLLPEWLCVQNFKQVMRSLLGLWTALVVLGLGIYGARYLAPSPAAAALSPLSALAYAVDDVQIHADEMAAAAGRGELATARRHAEHLVNLIVGKNSVDYGDLDGNGIVEDPGNGAGAVNDLARVRAGATASAGPVLDQMNGALIAIVGDAKAVLQAKDAASAGPRTEEAARLASGLRGSPGSLVERLAQALGAQISRPAAQNAIPAASGPQTETVLMQNFAFNPDKITVKAGTTIVFVNRDVAKHTVTADNGQFNSRDIDSGQSYTLKLDQPGTYPYYCAFHGDKGGVDMSGVIVVTP